MTARQWHAMFETFRTVARAAQAAQHIKKLEISRKNHGIRHSA